MGILASGSCYLNHSCNTSISGGVTPASMGRNIVFVGLIHPVTIRNVSFRIMTGNIIN